MTEHREQDPSERPPRRDPPRRRTPLLGPEIGIAALIGALWYTMDAFHRWDQLQACVVAGHRNCDR